MTNEALNEALNEAVRTLEICVMTEQFIKNLLRV